MWRSPQAGQLWSNDELGAGLWLFAWSLSAKYRNEVLMSTLSTENLFE